MLRAIDDDESLVSLVGLQTDVMLHFSDLVDTDFLSDGRPTLGFRLRPSDHLHISMLSRSYTAA